MTKETVIECYESTLSKKKENNKEWKNSMVVFWNKNTVYCYHRNWDDDENYTEVISKVFPGKLVEMHDWRGANLSKITRCESVEYVLKTYGGFYLAMEDA